MHRIAYCAAFIAIFAGSAAAGLFNDPEKQSVRAADFGAEWPLTVEKGAVACRRGGEAIFIYDGEIYALNGIAKRVEIAKDIDEISKKRPDFPDVSMSSEPLLQVALGLCSR